jgi:hypothetical protein
MLLYSAEPKSPLESMVTMELGAAALQPKKLYFVQSQRVFRLRVKDQLPRSMAQYYVLAS